MQLSLLIMISVQNLSFRLSHFFLVFENLFANRYLCEKRYYFLLQTNIFSKNDPNNSLNRTPNCGWNF